MKFALHITRGVDPQLGGTSVSVPSLVTSTNETGRYSNQLAVFGNELDFDAALSFGLSAEQILRLQSHHFAVYEAVMNLARLRQICSQADAIHIHGLWQSHLVLGALIAADLRKPYLVSAHGMLDSWALKNKRWKKIPYSLLIERSNLRRAACLRALTTTEIQDYRNFGVKSPVALIPNGVPPPLTSSPELFLQHWPELKGKKLVLFLSRVHYKKGVDILCRAWSQIRSCNDEAQLVIAGPDSENTRATLDRIIGELGIGHSITFTGMLRDEMKWSALAAATGFVLPSHSEGFSMAILEALAAAKPVVVTRQCNFSELAAHEFATVIDPHEDQLAEALASLLKLTASTLYDYGRAAKAFVELNYSWAKIGNDMADVYDWLLGGPRPPSIVLH